MMKNYVLLILFLMLSLHVSAQSENETVVNETVQEMDNFMLNDAVIMYPNPVQNYLTIHSRLPITRVMVFSLLGDRVKDVKSNFLRIDFRDLNSGIYMIKIYSNQLSVTKKLIKK